MPSPLEPPRVTLPQPIASPILASPMFRSLRGGSVSPVPSRSSSARRKGLSIDASKGNGKDTSIPVAAGSPKPPRTCSSFCGAYKAYIIIISVFFLVIAAATTLSLVFKPPSNADSPAPSCAGFSKATKLDGGRIQVVGNLTYSRESDDKTQYAVAVGADRVRIASEGIAEDDYWDSMRGQAVVAVGELAGCDLRIEDSNQLRLKDEFGMPGDLTRSESTTAPPKPTQSPAAAGKTSSAAGSPPPTNAPPPANAPPPTPSPDPPAAPPADPPAPPADPPAQPADPPAPAAPEPTPAS